MPTQSDPGTVWLCWLTDESQRERMEAEGWVEVGRDARHGTPLMELKRQPFLRGSKHA